MARFSSWPFFAFFATAVFLLFSNSQAKTWYLSPTGSDNQSCNSTTPFFSLIKVYECTQSGDVVLFQSGVYNYQLKDYDQVSIEHSLTIGAVDPNSKPSLILFDRTFAVPYILVTGAIDVTIYGLHIEGRKNTAFINSNTGEPDVEIYNMLFTGFSNVINVGIINGDYRNLLVHDSEFRAVAASGDVRAAGMDSITIENCNFNRTHPYNSIVSLGRGTTINIVNCQFNSLVTRVTFAVPTIHFDKCTFNAKSYIECTNIKREANDNYSMIISNSVWEGSLTRMLVLRHNKCNVLVEDTTIINIESTGDANINCLGASLTMNNNIFQNVQATTYPTTYCSSCIAAGSGNQRINVSGDFGNCPF